MGLNIKYKTFKRKHRRKSLERRTRKKIFRHGIKSIIYKNLINNFIKIKTFNAMKNPIKRMKRQATGLENIFTNHISDKGLIS